MGELTKYAGAAVGGYFGGAQGAQIGAGIGGALGTDPQVQANQNAATQANQGFNYLATSPLGTSYLPNGGAANSQAAALLGVGGGGVGGSAGGGSPGTTAALGTALQAHKSGGAASGAASGAAAGAALGPWGALAGGVIGGVAGLFSKKNNSPLQDIHQALQAGIPVSDASWAKAGYGPGGSPLGSAAPGGAPGTGGATGVADAQNAFGKYLDSTGYQFQLGQGQKAITTSNAARGLLNSGATAKALTQYGQNLGSNYFDKYLGQVNTLGQQGLTAGAAIGGAASQGGANMAQYTAAAGNAQANASNGGVQAIGSFFTPNAAGVSPAKSTANYFGSYF